MGDAGSVTAEVAVTFPVVLLALAVVLFAGSAARAGVTCVDGARAAARAVSAGEAPAVAVAQARAVLDGPAEVVIGGATSARGAGPSGAPGAGGLVTVTVRLDVGAAVVPTWSDTRVWRVPVSCRAHAWREPTA